MRTRPPTRLAARNPPLSTLILTLTPSDPPPHLPLTPKVRIRLAAGVEWEDGKAMSIPVPGATGVDQCWNVKRGYELDKYTGMLKLVLSGDSPPTRADKELGFGCVLNGVYDERHAAHIDAACNTPPPPPPFSWVPCGPAEAAFKLVTSWDDGFIAEVAVGDWRGGELIRLDFGAPLPLTEVRPNHSI